STVDVCGIAGVTVQMSITEVNILVTQAEVADSPLAAALCSLLRATLGAVDRFFSLTERQAHRISRFCHLPSKLCRISMMRRALAAPFKGLSVLFKPGTPAPS